MSNRDFSNVNNSNLIHLMFTVALFAAALVMSASFASAGDQAPSSYLAAGWNRSLYFPFLDELSGIADSPVSTPAERASCDRFYSQVRARGEMRIHLGIGYYDASEGEPFEFDYYPAGSATLTHFNFGMNATMDGAYIIMLTSILTARCHGDLELCGFTDQGDGVFTKWVRDPNGEKIRATITMKNGSLTSNHADNIGIYKAQQDAKSAETTQWFFNDMQDADMVIYNGHSRKGGGPDFSPPRLYSNLHVNYDYYVKNTPGLKRLLAGLKATPVKPTALMLMSCNSTALFEKKIAKVAPQVSFAGTSAVLPGDLPTKAALAGMDSFLRFQCQSGFDREMNADANLVKYINPLKMK